MAGHSKWANIRYRKGSQDAKRAKIFTKLIREITVASRMGGGDPDQNPRLRDAIGRAVKANMKKDTVTNAIKRGEGKLDKEQFFEIRYEGYGPAGVAIIVDCLTDNKNRTVSDVRSTFTKNKGNLAQEGAVSYLFNKLGIITLESDVNEEKVLEVLSEHGGIDMEQLQDNLGIEISVAPEKYHEMLENLEKLEYKLKNSEITYIASNTIAVSGADSETLIKLLETLEELDDVQQVYTNAVFSED